MATAGESLRGRISLIWPMYADELLYTLTEVTETNTEAIDRLVGLEFWGQRVGAEIYTEEKNFFNKKYIYGLIGVTAPAVAGKVLNISDPTSVTLAVAGTQGAGVLLYTIVTTGAKYGCLFEKLSEPISVPE
jgi:hypothetical protein